MAEDGLLPIQEHVPTPAGTWWSLLHRPLCTAVMGTVSVPAVHLLLSHGAAIFHGGADSPSAALPGFPRMLCGVGDRVFTITVKITFMIESPAEMISVQCKSHIK